MKLIHKIPKPLLDDLVKGRWIPIIGAGFSRNAYIPSGDSMPLWSDLGNKFAQELNGYEHNSPLDVISAYEHQFGRTKLIEKLTEFLFIHKAQASNVHRAFCSIPFNIVCTTNFDFLLERQYEITPFACTPLIEEAQLSINLESSSVALLKLHGDLNHPNRLIVTEEDYDTFIDKYPIISTYLSNLLITRTAVLIGYSLDDPDFRQIWQVLGNRLGKARRPAYALMVGARSTDISRFERRGVTVINLSDKKSKYSEIFTLLFSELRDYFQSNVIEPKYAIEEASSRELSLPDYAANRICFFAIPISIQPFYRERIFPIVKRFGLVPITAYDIKTPGENYLAKIDALIKRAFIIIVDVSIKWTWVEFKMAIEKDKLDRVLVIVDEKSQIQFDIKETRFIRRPELTAVDLEPFISEFQKWLDRVIMPYKSILSSEPERLLEYKENAAAVISAITLLETTLREKLDISNANQRKLSSIKEMLQIAKEQDLLSNYHVSQVMEWLIIRNEAVHLSSKVNHRIASQIVNGVQNIISGIKFR